jgi:hypothetical protein
MMVDKKAKNNFPNMPPPVLDCARVLEYAVLDQSISYSGHSYLFVDGKEVGPVPCLAICQNLQDPEILLMHCDREWTVLGIAAYDSVTTAKDRAAHIYLGVSTHWIETGVTEQEASKHLDELWGDKRCTFCGRRPDEIEQLISGEAARICNICIEEFYRTLHENSPAKE